jgi:hypothetical protein
VGRFAGIRGPVDDHFVVAHMTGVAVVHDGVIEDLVKHLFQP